MVNRKQLIHFQPLKVKPEGNCFIEMLHWIYTSKLPFFISDFINPLLFCFLELFYYL